MKKVLLSWLLLAHLVACTSDAPDPHPALTATFAASRTVVEVNEAVTFTEAPAQAARYVWDFGNGQTATVAAPSVTYAATGTFTVTLTTYSADNQATATSQVIRVGKRYLREVRITALPFLTPAGLGWDVGGSGPDVFVQLHPTAVAEAPATKTSILSNVTPASLPLTFAASTELTPGEWTVGVRDEDSGSDDTMREWTLDVAGPTPNRDAQGQGSYTLVGPPDNPTVWAVTLHYETR
ncbi:PKD domain containing protein [Hymenobacter roseosalivarius DSM 11622]|uniref:PKD domain containing protein n=1 Tax=Hymenobacter roseosalivarius DSM 11622 TaxID=645990 RepID=A0A1W1UGK2_9BACT|nr:PKD domain-containing protein [Hymenobacter roseosalivarius]SMB80169.1 PKD domain containing protein [Hymenobacter roseosalivarius DSM 11622]